MTASLLGLGLAALTLALAVVHITQGTSGIGPLDVAKVLTGTADAATTDVLVGSRLPRLLAGLLVGIALGMAGAGLQTVARNPLASPDTLAVNAGAYFAVVATAALGVTLPVIPAGAVSFVGGLVAAALVLGMSAGGGGPTRLILAGSASALALGALTTVLLLLFEQQTVGLFAWGNGSLAQGGLDGVTQIAPVVALGVVGMLLLASRLDILALGDDAATALGVPAGRIRLVAVLLCVLLSSTAVTLAGPIGFVGLCAPVLVRLLGRRAPALLRHRLLLPYASLAGVLVVLAADVIVRAAFGADLGVAVPTGAVTTVVGAAVLVWLARRSQDAGAARSASGAVRPRTRRRFLTTVGILSVLVAGSALAGMLAGDTVVLLGDLANWVQGLTGPGYTFVLDQRLPRVLAALSAGAALAVAGTAVQAVCRNPLAEPSVLGITTGAGLGAVLLLTLVPLAGVLALSGAAVAGALLTFALVYALAWRGGLESDRLVLVGVGVSAGLWSLTAIVLVVSDPWNLGKALTWLSGSTYGRTMEQVLPVVIALAALTPLLLLLRRRLDLTTVDDDLPRLLGVDLERTRLAILGASVVLTSAAVCAVGVVGFVGLVAPHTARAIVGGRHGRVLPVAALLGALLVSVADTVGRTVIAPSQVPAGLGTALLGAPYFVWLLWRSRR